MSSYENFVFDTEKIVNHTPFLIAALVAMVAVRRLFGLDRTLWRYCTANDHLRVAVALMLTILCATLLTFVYNRLDGISRSVPVLMGLLSVTGMIGARVATRIWLTAKVAPRPFEGVEHGQQQSVLLVGLNALAELYVKAVTEYGEGRVRVAGIIDYSGEADGMRVQMLPVFGGGRSIQDVVNELAVHGVFVDRVVITTSLAKLGEAGRRDLETFTSRSTLPVEFFADNIGLVNWAGAELQDEPVAEPQADCGPAFAFSPAHLDAIARRPYWRLKRAIDFTVALLMILTLWPVVLAVAAVVALDVGMPVIFWQLRPGVGGRPFKLYKFRTMSRARDRNGVLRSDAERLGKVGRFLRHTRLDELPQLVNILIGEMSFIGPRPLLPIDQSPEFAARLLVRPGLTGWGQIKGGRAISAADKAALDIWYVENASLKLDWEILKGTVPMVVHGEKVHGEAIELAWSDLNRSGVCRRRPQSTSGTNSQAAA